MARIWGQTECVYSVAFRYGNFSCLGSDDSGAEVRSICAERNRAAVGCMCAVDVESPAADFMEAAKTLQLYFIRVRHQHQLTREEALREVNVGVE